MRLPEDAATLLPPDHPQRDALLALFRQGLCYEEAKRTAACG